MIDVERATEAPDLVQAVAAEAPERAALVTSAATWTYAELDARIAAAAAELARRGVQRGDRVALWLPQGVPLLTAMAALWRLGAVACPISTRLPAAGVAERLALLQARACLTEADELSAQTNVPLWAPPGDATLQEATPTDPVRLALDAPATVIFTSGSTGRPKAALHAWRNHVASAAGANANMPLAPGDRWLLALPLYHVGGLAIVVRCWLAGATVVLSGPDESLAASLAAYGITHASLVATQLVRLLREAPEGLGQLKALLLGGSAIPTALLEEGVRRGLPVHTTYGLTEMASQVTTTPPGASVEQLRSSGRVLPYRALRIDASGEILVRGATCFLGYLEGETVRRPDRDGWFPTGDLGRLDEEGWLFVHGRADNRFISGGENIQPEEIERALMQCRGVAQAVVVPVPDAEFGQRPVAFIRVNKEGIWQPERWVAALREVMPGYNVPDAFYAWPSSADVTMKIKRSALTNEAMRRQSEQ